MTIREERKVRRLRIGEAVSLGLTVLLVIIGLFTWYNDDQNDERQLAELRQSVKLLTEDNANQTKILTQSQLNDSERTLLIKCIVAAIIGEDGGISCDIESLKSILNKLPQEPVGGSVGNQPQASAGTETVAQQEPPPPKDEGLIPDGVPLLGSL